VIPAVLLPFDTTHSAWLMSSLVLGCNGLLSGSASVIADLHVQLWRAREESRLAARWVSLDLAPRYSRASIYGPDRRHRRRHRLVRAGLGACQTKSSRAAPAPCGPPPIGFRQNFGYTRRRDASVKAGG